jgi:hypothetical protein
MVQTRQLRKTHIDAHYCQAIFKYIRYFASKYKKYTCLIFADDKHKIPIGEVVPTSTGVRNKKMATSTQAELSAADHDFTKLSITPSVSLFAKIPDDPIQSFYDGQVYVVLKNTTFQASSALRHVTEFYDSIEQHYFNSNSLPEIIIVYTDGGPDHQCNFGSVQISLIALFLNGNFDLVIAARTAPYHSWANPAERIMSILNLGLQGVALQREQMSNELESIFQKLNTLDTIRKEAQKNSILKCELQISIDKVQNILFDRIRRLKLHDNYFEINNSASEEDINRFFEVIIFLS